MVYFIFACSFLLKFTCFSSGHYEKVLNEISFTVTLLREVRHITKLSIRKYRLIYTMKYHLLHVI
jgi:hypothetical protein